MKEKRTKYLNVRNRAKERKRNIDKIPQFKCIDALNKTK